jgi:hypothetical protein
MLSRLELQRFQKNCFDAAFQCVRYADLENYLLGERNKESVVGRIESVINWLTDIDWMWWPLLSLRPKRTDRFSPRLTLFLSVLVVVIGHGVVIILRVSAGKPVPLAVAAVVTSVLLLLALGWFSLVALCWNNRAARLASK